MKKQTQKKTAASPQIAVPPAPAPEPTGPPLTVTLEGQTADIVRWASAAFGRTPDIITAGFVQKAMPQLRDEYDDDDWSNEVQWFQQEMTAIENRRMAADRAAVKQGPVTITFDPEISEWLHWASRTYGRAEIDIASALLSGWGDELREDIAKPSCYSHHAASFTEAYKRRMEMEAAL